MLEQKQNESRNRSISIKLTKKQEERLEYFSQCMNLEKSCMAAIGVHFFLTELDRFNNDLKTIGSNMEKFCDVYDNRGTTWVLHNFRQSINTLPLEERIMFFRAIERGKGRHNGHSNGGLNNGE